MKTEQRVFSGGDENAAREILKKTSTGTKAPEIDNVLDEIDSVMKLEQEPQASTEEIDLCPVCFRYGCPWYDDWVARGRPADELIREVQSLCNRRPIVNLDQAVAVFKSLKNAHLSSRETGYSLTPSDIEGVILAALSRLEDKTL